MTDDRRSVRSRNSKLAKRTAHWLARHHVKPNWISQASMVFAALAGIAFWRSGGDQALWLVLAALGIQARLLCNLLDGMVALENARGARDGAFWNEAPDRVADLLILVGAGMGAGATGVGWAAGAMAVLTAYVREHGTARGLRPDFSGPMAKPQRMAVMTGGALLATVLPVVLDLHTVTWALWVVIVGTVLTIARRARRIVVTMRETPPPAGRS